MKLISQKQKEQAIAHVADLLAKDGFHQTQTIQQWLDDAEMRPAQFGCSLPALQILGILGFGEELVKAKQLLE